MKNKVELLTAKKLKQVADACLLESQQAWAKYGHFHSAHEAYGILMEEVDEFWEEVRKKRQHRSPILMRQELIQIAAVAIKAAVSLT